MSIEKKAGAVTTKGGGLIVLKEMTSAGLELSTPASHFSLGYIDTDSGPTDKTPIEKQTDETGGVIKTTYGDREVILSGMLMQSDKDLLDFLKEGCRDKFYQVYRYEGVNNGNHQEFFYGIGMVTPQMELKSGAKIQPLEITILKNDSAITIASDKLPTGAKTSTDVSIPAGEYYKIIETAVA